MRTALIEFPSPRLDLAPSVVQRQEPMHVQIFVPEPAIEGLNERVVCGLTESGEIQRNFVHIGPLVKRSGDKLRAIVHPDLGGCRSFHVGRSSFLSLPTPLRPLCLGRHASRGIRG